MKKETKTILIGIAITIIILATAFLIFYFVYKNQNQITGEDNNTDLSTNTNTNQSSSTEIDNSNRDDTTQDTNQNENSTTSDNQEEKSVTIYLFRGEGCHFCENAIAFFESIADDYPYLEIKTYEVWRNESNRELMDAVASELDLEVSGSVPLIVIGTGYARRGFSENLEELIKQEIENAYQNDNYKDIVEQIRKDNDFQVSAEIIN